MGGGCSLVGLKNIPRSGWDPILGSLDVRRDWDVGSAASASLGVRRGGQGTPPSQRLLLDMVGVVQPTVLAKEDHAYGEEVVPLLLAMPPSEGMTAEDTAEPVRLGPLTPAYPCVGGGSSRGMTEHGRGARLEGHGWP